MIRPRCRPASAALCALLALSCCLGNADLTASRGGADAPQQEELGPTLPAGGAIGEGSDGAASDTSALDGDPNLVNAPFSPLPLSAQLRKLKMMLHGDPVTAAELAQAQAQGLPSVVAAWQKTAPYQERMVRFLSVALQQVQVTAENMTSREKGYQFTRGTGGTPTYKYLLENIHESMARTVLALDAQGQPFSSAMTTHQFMMTAPLAAFYVVDDSIVVADDGTVTSPLVDFSTRVGQNTLKFAEAYPNEAFTQWSLVTVRRPNVGEATSALPATRDPAPAQLVLQNNRQGFMTTPAFFNQWRSNIGNSSRVQINQALIVGIGQQFDGTNYVAPLSTAAMDAAHVQPNTACYSCHVDMDPMRTMYRRFHTYFGDVQKDAVQMALPSQFVYGGVSKMTSGPDDLGATLAAHPMMPLAWAQKVCAFANSAPCLVSDPELQRIATDFGKNMSFNRLVLNIFSSPLTTYARATQTTLRDGVTFPVTKIDQLCPLLSQRLGLDDVCGLDPQANPQGDMKAVQTVTSIFPANSFARGTVNTGQANDPTLFLRSGAENVCARLSGQVVDAGSNNRFPAGDVETAVKNLVHLVMGVGADDDTVPIALLTEHQKNAVAAGLSAGDAMRSTFVVACLSPSVMGVGQ